MTAADLPEVLEIERAVFPQPWTKGMFVHELRVPFSRSRVARLPGAAHTLAGYVCWWVVGDEAEILNIAVNPGCRRIGVGRVLVRLVLDDVVERGASRVSLEVEPDNVSARKLYESFGFSAAGRRRNYYARGVDALIMALEIEAGAAG